MPSFVSPSEVNVQENSALNTIVLVVKAQDGDEGLNGRVSYSLFSDSALPFTLGPTDGVLKVSGPLDRELQAEYLLNIKAQDSGSPSLSSSMNLTIQIIDVNDNSPVFDPRQYSASIAENSSIGASVLQVKILFDCFPST